MSDRKHPEADEDGRIYVAVHQSMFNDIRGTPKQRYKLKRSLERAEKRTPRN